MILLGVLLAGCGGSRVHVTPLVEEFDRYERDVKVLDPGRETTDLMQPARVKRDEAERFMAAGKKKEAYPLITVAVSDAKLGLASAQMKGAQRRSDECLREVEQARKGWEDALFVLQQTEGFLGQEMPVSRTAPQLGDEDPVAPLPATTLVPGPPPWDSATDLMGNWRAWEAAALARKMGIADLETAFAHHYDRLGAKGIKAVAKSLHLHRAGRIVQELECRVRQHVADDVCARTTRLAAMFGDAREEVLQATLKLERGLQDNLRQELERTREDAADRQNQLFEALSQLEGKYAKIRRDARGTIVSLADILFDFDKATLRRDVEFSLVKVATILNQFPEMNIAIEGHTDNIGTDEYNMDLSQRRAKSVYEFLVSQDVFDGRMTFEGFGESRPVADNSTDDGRQKNRRVDLVIQEGR
jgi:outer membrane protein OmpA-like peptidoglycan-associated protein